MDVKGVGHGQDLKVERLINFINLLIFINFIIIIFSYYDQ